MVKEAVGTPSLSNNNENDNDSTCSKEALSVSTDDSNDTNETSSSVIGNITEENNISQQQQQHLHIVFVVDSTASMNEYLLALKQTLIEINVLIRVMFDNKSADVSIYSYKDYSEKGMILQKVVKGSEIKLSKFCNKLAPIGGGDIAEACKTAFNSVSAQLRQWKNDQTIIFHFTDAPPHHDLTNPTGSNLKLEKRALYNKKLGFDWCRIAQRFQKASKRVKLVTIAPFDSPAGTYGAAFYSLLGELIVIPTDVVTPNNITQVTMAILLQYIGQEANIPDYASRVMFKNHQEVIDRLLNGNNDQQGGQQQQQQQQGGEKEEETHGIPFTENTFPELNTPACRQPQCIIDAYCYDTTESKLQRNEQDLVWINNNGYAFDVIPQIQTDLLTLSKKFNNDEAYKNTVFEAMKKLVVPEHVMALTTNQVFGRLWRLVCHSRDDPRQAALVTSMGDCGGSSRALSAEEKATLRSWLEDSYDNTQEINALIREHTESSSGTRYYVLDAISADHVPNVNDLRSLGRCPNSKALMSVQKVLGHIHLVTIIADNDDDCDGGDHKDESHLLSSKNAIYPIDGDGNLRYIPESFDDYQLFTMLPHLLQAGCHFSLKPAALLAILCCKSKIKLLHDRAMRFLLSIRGKWLPPVDRIDRAEIISYEFSSLIASIPEVLTEKESQFFLRLHEIWRYRRGRFLKFNVQTHKTSKTPMLLPDYKSICEGCSLMTSNTLLATVPCKKNPNGRKRLLCGICLWKQISVAHDWTRPKHSEPGYVRDDESYIVECVSCQILYAVLGPADLNVPPKCHYCRGFSGKKIHEFRGGPFVQCKCCKAKWCHPPLFQIDQETYIDQFKEFCDNYICAVCAKAGKSIQDDLKTVPDSSITTHTATLKKIMDQNPTWVKELGFRKRASTVLFGGIKMYESVVKCRRMLFLPPVQQNENNSNDGDIDMNEPRMFAKKHILNTAELINNIKNQIADTSFEGYCQMCFDEFAIEKLRDTCGNCDIQCCQDCLSSWYSQNKPGSLFLPSHDICPFCRQRPNYHILSLYNRDACGIMGIRNRQERNKDKNKAVFRSDWYYAWCQNCWQVDFALERLCAREMGLNDNGGLPEIQNFVCGTCRGLQAQKKELQAQKKLEELYNDLRFMYSMKQCPGCKMDSIHMGGCSHMTCPKCGIHWCWECAEYKADDGSSVYKHLHKVHGGIFW